MFSSQRKKDYEELIILRNTVAAFVKEIEEMLPPLTEENLATLKEEYFTQRGSTVERQKNELSTFENNHLATLDKVADKICTDLDNILPDEFVEYLFAIMANYAKVVHKVNASSDIQDEVLNMCYVDYPVDFFVQSKIVASIIKEKCSKLLVNGAIRLPIMMSTRNAPIWMITNDNSNSTAVQAFTRSIMYGLLSSCPVEKLTYTIVDPENRGNSISPFFDAKKKLPELFGERIYISKDEVAAKVSRTTNLVDYFADANIGATSELPAQIHMGTLIKVAPPFAICIDKKKKHNLLVCGSNERMANTISNNYMISALLNRNATVYCIDGDKLVGDDGSADFYDALGECSTQFKVAQDRADIIKFINEIYQSYQTWKKQNSDDVIFVVIRNLQFLDIVKSMFKGDVIDESEFIDEVSAEPEFNPADPFAAVNNMFANRGSDDNMSVGEKLIKMIEDGSGFGIHFVVTSLEYFHMISFRKKIPQDL